MDNFLGEIANFWRKIEGEEGIKTLFCYRFFYHLFLFKSLSLFRFLLSKFISCLFVCLFFSFFFYFYRYYAIRHYRKIKFPLTPSKRMEPNQMWSGLLNLSLVIQKLFDVDVALNHRFILFSRYFIQPLRVINLI